MTANELADINEWSCCAHSKEVSAMLRQQDKEIERLKAELEDCICQGGHSPAYLKIKER